MSKKGKKRGTMRKKENVNRRNEEEKEKGEDHGKDEKVKKYKRGMSISGV